MWGIDGVKATSAARNAGFTTALSRLLRRSGLRILIGAWAQECGSWCYPERPARLQREPGCHSVLWQNATRKMGNSGRTAED